MVIHHYIRPTEKEIVTCDAASPTVMYCSVSWHHSLSRHIHGSDTRVSNPASTMAAQTLLYHFGENDRLRSPFNTSDRKEVMQNDLHIDKAVACLQQLDWLVTWHC